MFELVSNTALTGIYSRILVVLQDTTSSQLPGDDGAVLCAVGPGAKGGNLPECQQVSLDTFLIVMGH